MFKHLRSLTEAIERSALAWEELAATILADIEMRAGDGDLDARIRQLEQGREKWEAEVEGTLLKAKGQYKAASAAEAREKTLQAHTAKLNDEGEEFDVEGYVEFLRQAGVTVPPYKAPLEDRGFPPPTSRELARARKAARRAG